MERKAPRIVRDLREIDLSKYQDHRRDRQAQMSSFRNKYAFRYSNLQKMDQKRL